MSDETFHLGAEVRSSDGRDVGELVHVLVGPDYRLRALVVKENTSFSGHGFAPRSWLVNDEFIVPKDAVKSATSDRIELSLSAADVRLLPPYLGYREKRAKPRPRFSATRQAHCLRALSCPAGWSSSPTSGLTSWRSTAGRT